MTDKRSVLVTGGAGFIGAAVCRHLLREGHKVVNVDKLTYAGNLTSLSEIDNCNDYTFVNGDICDEALMREMMIEHQVDAILHLAAESHVDRSIDGPVAFVETNVVGTFRLLSAAHSYWRERRGTEQARFRFLHVSTDEVFGGLSFESERFVEDAPYAPSSPYSASKAASDHFVRAWHRTYGLPVLLTHCSNNYGPFQYPDKLIPLVILNALNEQALPVYGTGENVRDWLYVDDHARGIEATLFRGVVGESYNLGGGSERTNLAVVETICSVLDNKKPRSGGRRHADLIRFVDDRPGHDRRYALDPSKAENDLSWQAIEKFEDGLIKTIDWYIANEWWWGPIRKYAYGGQRLGKH